MFKTPSSGITNNYLIAEPMLIFWILSLCSHLNDSLIGSCVLGKNIRKKKEANKTLSFPEGY